MREKRVLVVAEGDAFRTLLMLILRRRQLAADAADDTPGALERLASCRYAIVLLDRAPDRKDVLDAIRAQPRETRAIVLAITMPGDTARLDAAIVTASLSMPLDVEILVATIAGCEAAIDSREQLAGCPPADTTKR